MSRTAGERPREPCGSRCSCGCGTTSRLARRRLRDPRRRGAGARGRGRPAPGRGRGRFPPPGLEFTHLDKVFFPERGYTKADVIEYYRKIAPYILPHLKDRPLTLRRFPDGIGGKDFFQKDVPDAPAFVRTERVWSDQAGRDITVPVGAD